MNSYRIFFQAGKYLVRFLKVSPDRRKLPNDEQNLIYKWTIFIIGTVTIKWKIMWRMISQIRISDITGLSK